MNQRNQRTKLTISIIIIISIVVAMALVYFVWHQFWAKQEGGGRNAIFSRFHYEPDFPMISKLDQVDPYVWSKVYNTAGPLKFIRGRPYRFYRMEDGNWGYPWHFPERPNRAAITNAERRCGEDVVKLIKRPDGKLAGLGIVSPEDVIYTSKCFDDHYIGAV